MREVDRKKHTTTGFIVARRIEDHRPPSFRDAYKSKVFTARLEADKLAESLTQKTGDETYSVYPVRVQVIQVD